MSHVKPPATRQGRPRQAIRALSHDSLPRAIPPMPPGRWLAATRAAWAAYWASPVADLASVALDAGLLARWAFCLDELERARRAFVRERIVAGSMGQPRLSPAWTQIRELSAELGRLEQQLGIGPLNRMRLGIALGDAAGSLARLWDDTGDVEPEVVEVGGTLAGAGRQAEGAA